jgi:diaminopimelate epimerase
MHHFSKYHALANDMIVLDPHTFHTELTPLLIRRLCARQVGVGADGIVYGPLHAKNETPTMRFFNPDGSEAEKSGNGLRIFARYLWDSGRVTDRKFTIGINGEEIGVEIVDAQATTITIGLGQLTFPKSPLPDQIHVSIGNPHLVSFHKTVTPELAYTQGATLEHTLPQRNNVEFVQILDKHTIRVEIWERGAGYTLASGTCSSAAAGAAILAEHCTSPVTVQMVGGNATVAIDADWQVQHTSAVEKVYAGEIADMFLKSQGTGNQPS